MAAPTDTARNGTNVTTASTTWNVNVGSPSAGELLVVYCRFKGASGAVTFTGYSEIFSNALDASGDTTKVFWRWADGTEGATDTCNPTNSVKGDAICWRVSGAFNEAPAVGGNTVGGTSANTATTLSHAPNSPPQDTLYLTMAGGDGEVGAYTGAPTNYGNLITANSGTGGAASSNCFSGGASRQISASSSDDAGVFTHGAHVSGWTSVAVAVRPPAAGGSLLWSFPSTPVIYHQF